MNAIAEINSITQVANDLLDELHKGAVNSDGFSIQYMALANDTMGNSLLVAISETHDTTGEGYYSLHIIDDITGDECDLKHTDRVRYEELIQALTETLMTTVNKVCSANKNAEETETKLLDIPWYKAQLIGCFLENSVHQDENKRIVETVCFNDGFWMEIRCHGGTRPKDASWTEAALFAPNGAMVKCTDSFDEFLGEWHLQYGKKIYQVIICEEETSAWEEMKSSYFNGKKEK